MEMVSPNDILNDPGRLRWYRFATLLYYYGRPKLKEILHAQYKLNAPYHGKGLYDFLLQYKYQLEERPSLSSEERLKLFPLSGETDDANFDISLLAKVIIKILNCEYYYRRYDFSEQVRREIEEDMEFTKLMRSRRNWLYHDGKSSLSESMFENAWEDMCHSYCRFGINIDLVSDIKNGDIFSKTYQDTTCFFLSQDCKESLIELLLDRTLKKPHFQSSCPVAGLVKERSNLNDDFFLLNYWQDKSSASIVGRRILNHQFDHSAVELLCGPVPPCTFTYEKFKKRLKDLFTKFYKQNEKPIEVITIPIFTQFDKTQITKIWEQAMIILKEWCENSSIKCGLIVRNYNIKGHLRFSKIKIDVNEKFSQCNERLLVFNPAQRVVLTIYLVESAEALVEEVHNCIDEVNLLGLLLRDALFGSSVIVTGIVACPEKNSHNCCVDCRNFIVSYNIFTSLESFVDFWSSYIGQEVYKSMKVPVKNEEIKTFEAVAMEMVGFLAHMQYPTFDKTKLPSPKNSPKDNITETELLLNRYQMEIAYSKQNRILLTGSYGTGKSIIIEKKIEILLENIKDKEMIYYVNFEEKSHLDSIFRVRMKPSEKLKMIKSDFDLSHIIKDKILSKEDDDGIKTIHLMVEEYDTQRLSIREASQLNELFENQEQLKNSTIFIATQPIEISRIAYQKYEGEEEKILEVKPEMEELSNFHFYNLKYVMRMTKEIHNLARITEKYLNNKSSQFTQNLESDHNGSKTPEGKRRKKCSINTSQDQHLHRRKRADYDEYFSVLGTPNKEKSKSYQRFVTSYRYNLQSQIGHGISGDLPELFRLTELADHLQQIELIAFFLSNIIEINRKRVAIIHFESKSPHWLKQLLCLKHFQGLVINFDAGKFINQHLDQDKQKREIQEVLVTDFRSVKGLEFSDVLLLLNENEYHCRHFIPEAITRCMSKLSILLVPCHKEFNQSGTILAIADEWEQINSHRPKNPILKVVKLEFCLDRYCQNDRDIYCKSESSIFLHTSNKFYRKLQEEIENKFVRNWQSDNEKEKKDANIL